MIFSNDLNFDKTIPYVFLAFQLFITFIIQYLSAQWMISENLIRRRTIIVVHLLQLGLAWRIVETIRAGWRAYTHDRIDLRDDRRHSSFCPKTKIPPVPIERDSEALCSQELRRNYYRMDCDQAVLRLFHGFSKAAPQLLLQLYKLTMFAEIKNEYPRVIRREWLKTWIIASSLCSLVSLSWSIAAYTKSLRISRMDKKELSVIAVILIILWRVGTLGSRFIALLCFAVLDHWWFLGGITAHAIAMFFWIVRQKTDLCDTVFQERLYNVIVAIIYSFCFFNVKDGPSRARAAIYYLIFALENITCACLYHVMVANDMLTKLPRNPLFGAKGGSLFLMNTTILSFVAGILAMVVYYRFFHPSSPTNLLARNSVVLQLMDRETQMRSIGDA